MRPPLPRPFLVTAAVGALLLLAGARIAAAQATGIVTGTVIEGGSQKPLPGVSVILAGSQRGAMTNQDGRFRIPGLPAGTITLQIRAIGYRSVTRTVPLAAGDSARVDVALTATAIQFAKLCEEPVAVVCSTEDRIEFALERPLGIHQNVIASQSII